MTNDPTRWQGAAEHVRRMEAKAAEARLDADKATRRGDHHGAVVAEERAEEYDRWAAEWRLVAPRTAARNPRT